MAFIQCLEGRARYCPWPRQGRTVFHRPLSLPSGVTKISTRPVAVSPSRAGVVEIDAGGAHVVAEHLSQLIIGDLADERPHCNAPPRHPPRGKPRQRRVGPPIRRKSRLARGQWLRRVSSARRLVDQGHPPRLSCSSSISSSSARRHFIHVDHGIADGNHVITGRSGFGHGRFLGVGSASRLDAFAARAKLLCAAQHLALT